MKRISLAGLAVAAVLAIPASAQTIEELQALIAQLQAQIAALAGGGSSAGCYAFVSDLTIGSQNAEVTALQNYLASTGHFGVAATGYFGPITQSALAAWQSANGVAPAAGYWGPVSRAKYNSVCTPSSSDDDDDDDNDNSLDGGEASLEDFNAKSGEDSQVEEGGRAEVAVFQFDVEDGDCEVQRVDVTFARTSGSEDGDETFEAAYLTYDGDVVSEVEGLDDEDEWLSGGDTSSGVIRFSNVDTLINEGDQAEFGFEIEAQDGIDNLPETWTVEIDTDDIRCLDGEGIDQYIGDTTDTVSFDVVEGGEDDELSISESDDDLEASVLEVDDSTTEEHTVAVMTLRADDNPVVLENFKFSVTVGTDTIFNEVVNDLYIVLDGEEYDDWTATGGTTTVGTVTVDLSDEDPVIDGEVELEVVIDFKAQVSGTTYDEGSTVLIGVDATTVWDTVDAEGEESGNNLSASQLKGSYSGETHTLRQQGILTTLTSTSATSPVGGDEAQASYTIKFTVQAFGADFYIEKTAARDESADGSDGVEFYIEDATSTLYATPTVSVTASLVASGSNSGDNSSYYKISEGNSRSFTLTVAMDNELNGVDGFYGVQVAGISFDSDGSGAIADNYLTTGLDDYETDRVFVDQTDATN